MQLNAEQIQIMLAIDIGISNETVYFIAGCVKRSNDIEKKNGKAVTTTAGATNGGLPVCALCVN